MAPYLDRRDEIDPGLLRIIETELRNPPTKYVQAWFDRLAWWQHPRAFFEKYDLLLTPTMACPPFKVGLDNPTEIAGRPAVPYAWIPFTYPFNLTGQPAASVPAGSRRTGCRSGLQIVGRRFADATVCARRPRSSNCGRGRSIGRRSADRSTLPVMLVVLQLRAADGTAACGPPAHPLAGGSCMARIIRKARGRRADPGRRRYRRAATSPVDHGPIGGNLVADIAR